MPVDCVLETEDGDELERVDDPTGVLNHLIPEIAEDAFHCWRFVNAYGDTVFNVLQMPQFLKELAVLRERSGDEAASHVLDGG